LKKHQIENHGYAKRFVKGSGLLFAVGIASSGVGFLLRIFLARTLGAEEFGLFFLAIAFFSIFGIRDLGLGSAVVKYIPEFKVKREYNNLKSSIAIYALFQVFVAIIISLLSIVFSDWLAVTLFRAPEASSVLKLLAGWFLFESLFYTFRVSFQGLQDVILFSMMGFFQIFLPFISVLLLVLIFPSATTVAFGYLVGLGITVLIGGGLFFKRHAKIMKAKVEIGKSLLKKLFKFALPVLVAGLAPIFIAPMNTILLGLFRSTVEVGFYHVAISLVGLLAFSTKAMIPILFPMISEMWTKGERELVKRAIEVLVKFSLVLMIPAAFIFIAFPDVVLTLFVGSEYLAASFALQILAMNGVIITLTTLIGSTFKGVGKPVFDAVIIWVMAPAAFLLSLFLIPFFGIEGAGTAVFISSLIGFGMSIFYARKLIELAFPFPSLFKAVAGAVMALLIVWGLKAVIDLPIIVETIVVLGCALSFYMIWILRTKTLNRPDLVLLKNTVPVPKQVLRVAQKFIPQ
jgi:stage V sporulation protein B